MCLIAYSPKGTPMTRAVFDTARWVNADGIGVMSRHGVEKFVGHKAGKRAWRYLRVLPPDTPYAVHFRYATHGAVCRYLTHPFQIPGRESYVMHNGIISKTANFAKKGIVSDTSLYVAWYMKDAPAPSEPTHVAFKKGLEKEIGWGNKMVIFHADRNEWDIANEDEGEWIDGVWYSNTYSLPDEMRPAAAYGTGKYCDWYDSLSPETVKWLRERDWQNKPLLPSGPILLPDDNGGYEVAENGEPYMIPEEGK
jgi:hypothetical protein